MQENNDGMTAKDLISQHDLLMSFGFYLLTMYHTSDMDGHNMSEAVESFLGRREMVVRRINKVDQTKVPRKP